MAEEECVDLQIVVRSIEVYGHVGWTIFCREILGMGDVGVVGKTAVFCVLCTVEDVSCMDGVAVGAIASEYFRGDARRVLMGVVTPPEEVVDLCTDTGLLVDVAGEVYAQAVVTIDLVTLRHPSDVGDGGFGVGKDEVCDRLKGHAIGARKDELGAHHVVLLAIVDAGNSGGSQVARVAVVAVNAVVEVGKLEEVRKCIRLGRCDAAEAFVDPPRGKAAWDDLGAVGCCSRLCAGSAAC